MCCFSYLHTPGMPWNHLAWCWPEAWLCFMYSFQFWSIFAKTIYTYSLLLHINHNLSLNISFFPSNLRMIILYQSFFSLSILCLRWATGGHRGWIPRLPLEPCWNPLLLCAAPSRADISVARLAHAAFRLSSRGQAWAVRLPSGTSGIAPGQAPSLRASHFLSNVISNRCQANE